MLINSPLIKNSLNNYFNLEKDEYLIEELNEVTSLMIDGNPLEYDKLEELKYFNNLEDLVINDLHIDENNYLYMNSNNLVLNNCYIDINDEVKHNTKSLVINGGRVDNLSFINNLDKLESLYLDNIDEVDLSKLSLRRLKEFSVLNTKLINQDRLFYLENVVNLNVCDTKLEDLSICFDLDNLKYLVVSESQAIENKEYIMKLIAKGVKVVNFSNQSVEMYYE